MAEKKAGVIVILSSPSGAGKTTLVKKISLRKKYKISISGEGESGYKFKEIVINNVFYDTIPPKYNFDVPEFLNSPRAYF